MIRINLLPQDRRPKLSTLRLDLGVLILTFVLLGGAILLSHRWISGQQAALQQTHDTLQAESMALASKVAKVRNMEKELAAMETKIQVIKDIRDVQTLPVRYVDTLISLLPEEKIWFETFNLSKNGALQLKGVAMDNQSFAAYVEILRSSAFVRGVVTERTLRREVQGLSLVEFHFRVNFGPPPEDYFQEVAADG